MVWKTFELLVVCLSLKLNGQSENAEIRIGKINRYL